MIPQLQHLLLTTIKEYLNHGRWLLLSPRQVVIQQLSDIFA
jgi:hypothetical protein